MPVVIKGTGTIGTPEKFRITVQNAVKNTLKEKNMRVTVPSDFEHIIKLLDEGTISLQEKDVKGTILEAFDLEEIKLRLQKQQDSILLAIEDILEKKRLGSIQGNIVEWLAQVKDELHEKHGIDYVMIFWDEFTGALNQMNVEDILLEIQNIAEAKNKGLSVFIVSHRTRSNQLNVNEENVEKILDRFKKIHYTMEPIATYELMERSITKDAEWENVKNRYVGKIKPLIQKISNNEGPKVEKALEDLYPIHPYTSFLATFIAREIGSTERSIFRFLHDDSDNGFKKFIDTYNIDQRYFLTAEYLWDFFYNDFEEKDDDKISSSVQKYKLHYKKLNEKGIEYLTIFKVILLLNILYKIAEVSRDSLAIPSRENIKNTFIGSIYEDKVEEVLNYIDQQGIINESPEHYFELTTNSLDPNQVSKAVEKLRKNLTIKTILEDRRLSKITDNINNKVIRGIEIVPLDGNMQKNRLISNLNEGKFFKKPGYLHMLLFLSKNEKELLEIKKTIKEIDKSKHLKDTIIVISESSFKEKNLEKFLKFKGEAEISKKYNYKEDVKVLNERANKLLDDWTTDIRTGMINWHINDNQGQSTMGEFISTINEVISKDIFYYGIENINETRRNKNIWPKKQAKTQAEHYLNSRSYDELSSKLHQRFLLILQDNNEDLIVNSNLQLHDNIPNDHPIKKLQEFVDAKFEEEQKKGKFNLGESLKELTEAPYGLYPNEVNIAALSFVMRKYINKLYDEKGLPINAAQMKEKVLNTFEYWDKNKKKEKLTVRFGSEEEKKLIKLLIEIFNLDIDNSEHSIDTTRWAIRDWIKENKFPLWLLNYSKKMTPALETTLNDLYEILKPEDAAIPDEYIQDAYYSINSNRYDFIDIINSNKNEMLETYICGINEQINPEDIPEICEYVNKTMPEEVHSWNEDTVRQTVYEWLVENIRKNEPEKITSKIALEAENSKFGDDFTAIVTIDNNATGFVDFYIDNRKIESVKITDGKSQFKTNKLREGNHTIYALYQGNEEFDEVRSETKNFNIILPGSVKVNGKDFKNTENAYIAVESNQQSTIKLYLDDTYIEEHTIPITGLRINLGKLNPGQHNVKVEYANDPSICDQISIKITENKPRRNNTEIIAKVERENAENVKNATIKVLKENEDFREAFEKIFKG